MALSIPMRKKLIYLRIRKRLSFLNIVRLISENDNVSVSRTTAMNWTKKVRDNGDHYVFSNKRPGRGNNRKKFLEEHYTYIDNKIRSNPELSSVDLQKLFLDEFAMTISSSYIRHLRQKMGWVFKSTKYGQMIRDPNKEKRLKWAEEQIANDEKFDNVIFSDEASVEIQRAATKTLYKKGEIPQFRPKPKHPLKVSSCNKIQASIY